QGFRRTISITYAKARTLSPPLSSSEPEMRPRPWAFFFLSQRRLAETPEPRRLAPDSIFSPNAHPSLTERTSHRAVRLREGQCFQHIPRSAWAHLLLPFSWLALAPRERVGVLRRKTKQSTLPPR